ncbi:PREDICTED: protein transport protein sec31 [Camelina sativa]|uniref:Protein transport protein sec31 n=1 Tax=Camelina sativa TaxID=90675 RepID=A0ABM0T2W0_CAMSA|nr:PREDICTED: protein transport protein sec31 [Camelina sativa]
MNTALYSDKQIMDLMNEDNTNSNNNSQDGGDHQKHRAGDNNNGLESKKEAIFPSYDFQPIRPNASVGLSHHALDLAGSVNSTAARVWDASDPKPVSTSSARSYGSMDSLEPSKLFAEKNRNASESAILSAIDLTMKAHADNLIHVIEGVSARLTQLETRTRNLENLVDDVKVSVGNSHGITDGKLRQLENIMLEVQSGVQMLKDKQDIVEAQLQLSKLQLSKVNQQPEKHSTHVEPTPQPPASLPQPPASAAAPPSLTQQGLPPQQFIQPPASQHSLPPPSSQLPQLPNQFSPQQEPYFPPPGQSQPPPTNQPPYQPPPPTQSLHQPPYQSPPQQPQYPQQPPQQLQHPSGYNPEEPPYPQQSYPPNPPRQPPSHPPSVSAPSQQYYNGPPTPPSMYDGSGGRSNSGFASGYSPEPYQYTGPPSSQYGNTPSVKPPHQSGSGSGAYPQLPMARPLPQGLPMASAISSGGSGGSGSPRSGSRAPVDDVIDKVVSMGFPRDQVRGTVRTLTENGQAVDLNVVLDKLMNGDRGGMMQQQQPPRGWFGGR